MPRYDRGVRWEQEGLDVHGTRWVAMYLPVWLYSYHQPGKNQSGLLHYIAVNGRTGETMGSIPVQQWKLLLVALTVGTFLEGIVETGVRVEFPRVKRNCTLTPVSGNRTLTPVSGPRFPGAGCQHGAGVRTSFDRLVTVAETGTMNRVHSGVSAC